MLGRPLGTVRSTRARWNSVRHPHRGDFRRPRTRFHKVTNTSIRFTRTSLRVTPFLASRTLK